MSTSTPLFEPIDDIDWRVDWEVVAEVLAKHILADDGYEDALKQFDAEACRLIDEETRHVATGSEVYTDWANVYAAARLLRDIDAKLPAIRGRLEGVRAARKLAEAQQAAARDMRQADPTKQVLISPRLRGNVIERIVQTYADKVVAEYLHSSSGWNRHGAMDLRVVLDGMPLPARISAALSRQKGAFDELPTTECLLRFRAIDARAQFSEDEAERLRLELPLFADMDDGTEIARLTEAEVRNPADHPERGRLGGDATNAEIAAAVLASVPALWNTCTLVAEACEEQPGFTLRIWGPRREDRYFRPRDDVALGVLVARRFEMMETKHDKPWRRMVFRVARADHPEWQCHVTYDY